MKFIIFTLILFQIQVQGNPNKPGTEIYFSESQLDEIIPWAENSKNSLYEILKTTFNLPQRERINRIKKTVIDVLEKSKDLHSELLMRYTLNRLILLDDLIVKEFSESTSLYFRMQLMEKLIEVSLNYYQSDIDFLYKKKSHIDYAEYGENVYRKLIDFSSMILNLKMQYKFYYLALSWYSWDMYRDYNNKTYAIKINLIQKSLKDLPKVEDFVKDEVQYYSYLLILQNTHNQLISLK